LIRAAIFDLDGVIVDTSRHHYLAWKTLADELGIPFGPEENELLKGVSRMDSLDIILGLSPLSPKLTEAEKQELAAAKNRRYVESIKGLTPADLLPGVRDFLTGCRNAGLRTALASASRNAGAVINSLEIGELFDSLVDGTRVSRTKPDPEVFLCAARDMGVEPAESMVFEDAAAGVRGALAAGMWCVGIGDPLVLRPAHRVIPGFADCRIDDLISRAEEDRTARRWI
jgi:beta-phosphoglucomutase